MSPSIAESADRFDRPVVCAWCNNKHRSVMTAIGHDDDHTLGDGCATDVWQVTDVIKARLADKGVRVNVGDWMANAHYGSGDDCTLWRWVANAPSSAADPVCDNCIGERERAGDLKRVGDRHP